MMFKTAIAEHESQAWAWVTAEVTCPGSPGGFSGYAADSFCLQLQQASSENKDICWKGMQVRAELGLSNYALRGVVHRSTGMFLNSISFPSTDSCREHTLEPRADPILRKAAFPWRGLNCLSQRPRSSSQACAATPPPFTFLAGSWSLGKFCYLDGILV